MSIPEEMKQIKVLVVEEEDGDQISLLELIDSNQEIQFISTRAGNLVNALSRLNRKSFDIILLDLSNSGERGFDSFTQMYTQVPDIPIVVVNGHPNPDLALRFIREGAEDYLVKQGIQSDLLERSILFSIERHRQRTILQHQSMNDDLTLLLNRRGFWSLASQHFKIAQRAKWEFLLVFADLDGLKEINDTFGHPEGDQALRMVARILNETFRTSDVIARLGGDEFVVLAVNTTGAGVRAITKRLQDNINKQNAKGGNYILSLSFGVARFDPYHESTLEDLIAEADKAMFESKRTKR